MGVSVEGEAWLSAGDGLYQLVNGVWRGGVGYELDSFTFSIDSLYR
jgi:hypothetical protein